MVYGVDGDLAIIGTSVPAVTAVQRPTSPLSASADFQAGTSGMPDEVTSVMWVNVERGRHGGRASPAPSTTRRRRGPRQPAPGQERQRRGRPAATRPTFEVFVRIAG